MQEPKKVKERHPVVIVERGWKEYLGECLLIVFSVILALGLTEYFTSLHDNKKANEILHQLKEELINNKRDAQKQYDYHLQVFKTIDSAEKNPAFAKQFLDSGKVHLHILFSKGVLLHDLNDVAWQQAKQNDIFSKIDFQTYSLLTDIYDNQARFLNLEPSIEKILVSYDARKPENLQITLLLLHDAIYGWVTERTPNLLQNYQEAIDRLKNY